MDRFRRLKDEEQRRWEEEKREEARRLENMKLSEEEREKILQVIHPSIKAGKAGRRRQAGGREEKVIRSARAPHCVGKAHYSSPVMKGKCEVVRSSLPLGQFTQPGLRLV